MVFTKNLSQDFFVDDADQLLLQTQSPRPSLPSGVSFISMREKSSLNSNNSNNVEDDDVTKARSFESYTSGLQPAVMITTPQENENNGKKKKKPFMIPWWTTIIAYFLSLVAVAVAFWVTVEVAGVFGPVKAANWLKSFVVSFVESVFLSQPIKVSREIN